jgi:hypothetical protein
MSMGVWDTAQARQELSKRKRNMKTSPWVHNGKPSNRVIFRELLRRKSLMDRLGPVLGELLSMVQGRNDSSRRKKVLPEYCYKILQALQKTHFKVLPAADAFGENPENLNWEALGRVVGAGLRCVRFGELEWDKIMAQEVALDSETKVFIEMIRAMDWMREQDSLLVDNTPCEGENHFVKGAEELWAAAMAWQQTAFQCGAGAMAQLNGAIQQGIEGFLDEGGQFVTEHARDNIYWFLLIVWPEIQEMQQSGDKTRKDFADWIQPFASSGVVSIRDLDQLLDVCDDIGLKFKGRGAPRKK